MSLAGRRNRKAELRGKLESFEHNRLNRFEPAIQFVLEAKHAAILVSEGNPEKNRDFLKKIGSNLQVADKSLAVNFVNPWQYVVDFNSDPALPDAQASENSQIENWRRGWDSNPRYSFWPYTGLANQRLKPLGHLSVGMPAAAAQGMRGGWPQREGGLSRAGRRRASKKGRAAGPCFSETRRPAAARAGADWPVDGARGRRRFRRRFGGAGRRG
jgi:hypothetical protein